MKIVNFSIEINAPAKDVWFALWDPFHYRQWTSVFCEGSYADTDNWKEGTKVHFLSPGGEGMYSMVTENKTNQKMFFTHIGNVVNFKEQPLDDETKEWTGARENYSLLEKNGKTILSVEMDLYEKYAEYFGETFPNGLKKVKTLAENLNIIIETKIKGTVENIWEKWSNPNDIIKWNSASKDWHTPKAENNLVPGGSFNFRMEEVNGTIGFDFEGKYTLVEYCKAIEYTMADNRTVYIRFETEEGKVKITESFQPEQENSYELQRDGWQSILNNFKQYCEN